MEGGASKDAGDPSEPTAAISVHVKFAGRTLVVSISPDATVADLKSLLLPLTNVIPRGQKLIFKGKVLMEKESLKSLGITNGTKLMLLASQGLHQGDGPITKDTTHQVTNPVKGLETKQSKIGNKKAIIEKTQSERWRMTGVIALSEHNLEVLPEEVWACGPSARVLDVSNNSIRELSDKVVSLKSLKKLLLNANSITDESISWKGLSSLKSLTVLSLSQNYLTSLPSAVGTLTTLCQLHIANNKITTLPAELGMMSSLQILKAENNRISALPSTMGNCQSLVEIDLSCNLLVDLPETFGNLHILKALYLKNNALKSLPSALFKMCSQLSLLDVHGTEITNDVLRQIEGWEEFDERRRLKHQKQLDFRAGFSGAFDEGADDSRTFK